MSKETAQLTAMNDRFIVETYKKEALKSEVKKGFATIGQKNTIKGLKILVDAQLSNGTVVKAGQRAYIKEETLHTATWATKNYECDAISVPFMVVDIAYVEFVGP